MDVGEKIKHLRHQKKWTQKQLAAALGVDKSTVSQYETYIRTPSFEVLVKLCYIFQVSADFFLDVHVGGRMPLSLDGLTKSQIFAVMNIIEEFRNANESA